jgi:hypothetical protein
MFVMSLSVPGRSFQPSLMVADKARSQPMGGVPERCSTVIGFGLTCKHLTMLEKLAEDKKSRLLHIFVNYGRIKFYNIGPKHQKMQPFS